MVSAHRRSERGFTLIELMVVVLVIAVLIAIAIPTFLGARAKAEDKAIESDLHQGFLTAKTYYTDNETFLSTDLAGTATAYHAAEPSMIFLAGPATATKETVFVQAATQSSILLVGYSAAGKWMCIGETVGAGTQYGTSTAAVDPFTALANCTGGW